MLAVSGGVDSMVLLNAMITIFGDDAKDRLVVAHVNYGLRAQTVDEEQLVHRFVSCIKFQLRQSIGKKQRAKKLLKNPYVILDMISSAQ